MARCETCGNDYDKAFQVSMNGTTHSFDSFECAIHALAPKCENCGIPSWATASRRKGLSSAASTAPRGSASPACAIASVRRHEFNLTVRQGSGRTIYLQAQQGPRVREIHSRRSKAVPGCVIRRLAERNAGLETAPYCCTKTGRAEQDEHSASGNDQPLRNNFRK